MIVLLSPAKSLNLQSSSQEEYSVPKFQTEANKLVKELRKYKKEDLQNLMNISDPLAIENVSRFKSYKMRAPLNNSKRAIDLFAGDVYRGLNVQDFSKHDYSYAQGHLRILSGLYGILKPLDMIQPYRLEMSTRLKTESGKNLYEFWGNKITQQLNASIKNNQQQLILNLASEEYFKVLKKKKIKARVVTINFKEYHDGSLKFLSFPAKVARGTMARYIIKNQVELLNELKAFSEDRYSFSEEHSKEDTWMFIR